ncbi:MAG: NAD-dependent epimerase/dehydratase family protein [Candidatus Limnocylindrales bacterium]
MSGDGRRRVLLTGAGGFVGRRVMLRRPAAWDLVALSRQELPPHDGVSPVRLGALEAALPPPLEEPFDAVIHLAGNSDHGLAVREPWSDVAATAAVAAALLTRVRTSRVVVLSSAAVYAGREGLVGPALCVQPTMPYALSKRYVEGLVGDLVARGRVDGGVILRLYNVFGPGERASRLIPRVVAAAREGRTFRLTGDPRSLSDPLHIDDVVDVLVAAAESAYSGTLDLCGGDARPLVDQIGRIATALELPVPVIEALPDPDQTPIGFWSDPRPTMRALALPPLMAFPAAIRRYGMEVGWLS